MADAAQLVEAMHVQNFACARDVELGLTPLHALIGPNDSGKSTLLRALRTALHLAVSGFTIESPTVTRPFSPGPLVVGTSIQVRFGASSSYRFTSEQSGQITESFSIGSGASVSVRRRSMIGLQTPGPFLQAPETMRAFKERLIRGARMVHLVPGALREPGGLIPADGKFDFRDEFGGGLPGILDAVLNRGDDSFLKIVDGVRRLFPTVRKIGLRPISSNTKAIEITLTSGARVPAEYASEGMLFYLAFAALQYLDPVAVLLVEEPENGLHPARIADVMRILREVSQETQVLLATHSPLVINEMQGDEVTLVTRDPEAGTQVERLSNTPNFAERSKVYALGELWLSYANGVDEAPLLRGTQPES
jgi:energy-coupling factor transporter ATP-binding protein EcfA2